MRRLLHILRRGRAALLLEGAGAIVVVAVLLMAPGGGASGTARVELTRAAGTLSLANSKEGAAIFAAANMRPGQQAGGSVTVTSTGTLPAALMLSPGARSAAGAAGRLLESRLKLVVFDVTDIGRPVTMYAGSLASMPATALGDLAAGRSRDFRFVASLPSAGSNADNAVQGASLAAGFTWTAAAAGDPLVTPLPTAVPTPPPTVVPAPTPQPPAARKCKARKVRIRIRSHGRRILRVTVKVGHEHAHKVKPRRRITVKVKSAKRVRVKVTVKLAGGRHMTISRRARGRC